MPSLKGPARKSKVMQPNKNNPRKRFYSIRDIQEILDISYQKALVLVQTGILRDHAVLVGGVYRVPIVAFNRAFPST